MEGSANWPPRKRFYERQPSALPYTTACSHSVRFRAITPRIDLMRHGVSRSTGGRDVRCTGSSEGVLRARRRHLVAVSLGFIHDLPLAHYRSGPRLSHTSCTTATAMSWKTYHAFLEDTGGCNAPPSSMRVTMIVITFA